MSVFVTGIAGFIGSHMAHRLVREGYTVEGIDNFHTGNMENLDAVKGKVKVYHGNAGDIAKHAPMDVETIIHYGVFSSTPMYKEEPRRTAIVINDCVEILEYARKHDCRIVMSSSSSVYNGLKEPFHEAMEIPVTDFYTEARLAMERISELYSKLYGISTVCLRNFSIYGPNEKFKKNYANMISQLLWSLLKKESPIIYGDGKQTRDFVYVDDAVEAVFRAMKRKDFEIFNVGSGRAASFNEVLHMLKARLNSSIEPTYVENKISNYVYTTRANTSKAAEKLGFRAIVSLEEGIDKLIAHYGAKR